MDSQAIGPTNSPTASTPTTQVNGRTLTPANAKAADAPKATKKTEDTKPVEHEEVRTRDPRSLQYQVDGSTKQVVATIVDESNRLVIRQIPDAEVLRIAQAIDRMKGFLLEGKA